MFSIFVTVVLPGKKTKRGSDRNQCQRESKAGGGGDPKEKEVRGCRGGGGGGGGGSEQVGEHLGEEKDRRSCGSSSKAEWWTAASEVDPDFLRHLPSEGEARLGEHFERGGGGDDEDDEVGRQHNDQDHARQDEEGRRLANKVLAQIAFRLKIFC